MKNIIQNAYRDTIEDIQQFIPAKIQSSFQKNKKRFLLIALSIIVLELAVALIVYINYI